MDLIFNEQSIATDAEGYLLNLEDWCAELVSVIAAKEQLELNQDHWQVIDYVRKFYMDYQKSPSIRPLVKYLKQELGEAKGNSIFLHTLFPGGPAKQACKLAGLPKPARCI